MSGLNRPIRDRCRSGRSSGVCGGADGRAIVADGMLRRTIWKLVRYAGELMQSATSAILRLVVAILTAERCARWSRLKLVSSGDGVQMG